MHAGGDRRLRRCRRAVAVNAYGAPGSSHKIHMENDGSHQTSGESIAHQLPGRE
jgi:hypothetical protein